MAGRSDTRQLVRRLRKLGLDVRVGPNGHYQVFRGGVYVTTFAFSPSDSRWRQNAVADLRRKGIHV